MGACLANGIAADAPSTEEIRIGLGAGHKELTVHAGAPCGPQVEATGGAHGDRRGSACLKDDKLARDQRAIGGTCGEREQKACKREEEGAAHPRTTREAARCDWQNLVRGAEAFSSLARPTLRRSELMRDDLPAVFRPCFDADPLTGPLTQGLGQRHFCSVGTPAESSDQENRMNRRLIFLASLALLLITVGCGGRTRYRPRPGATGGAVPGAEGTNVAAGVVAHGTPAEQLDQYDAMMRQAGYQPVGDGATRGVLSAAQPIVNFPIDVRRNYCYALTVIGAPSSNVDMFVLDPLGRDASHNVLPDAHPWSAFCAARGGRFTVRVQLAAGEGEFFFAPYEAPGRNPVSLAAFFGGAAVVQSAQLDATTQARLGVLDQTLATERYARVGAPSGVVFSEHQERAFQLSLQQGQCYAFASLGGAGATDTDLQLFDGSGVALQTDQSEGQDALVRYCATETAQYRLQVRLPTGAGPVFTVAYAQPAATPPAGGTQVAAEPVLTEPSGGGVEENFALLDSDMRARGYETLQPMQRGQLVSSGARDYQVTLEDDKCYALLAVGDGGVRSMRMSLLDPAGREVDHDETGSRPTVRACTTVAGNYTVRVLAQNGAGSFAFGAYRWPRGTRGPFGLEGLTYVRFSEMTGLLEAEGFQFDANYAPQQTRIRREGQESTQQIQLTGGQCYSIMVAGGDGIRDLDATLSLNGQQVASDTTTVGAFLALRHCADAEASFTLTVRATRGAGQYVSQIFTRGNASQ